MPAWKITDAGRYLFAQLAAQQPGARGPAWMAFSKTALTLDGGGHITNNTLPGEILRVGVSIAWAQAVWQYNVDLHPVDLPVTTPATLLAQFVSVALYGGNASSQLGTGDCVGLWQLPTITSTTGIAVRLSVTQNATNS